MEIFKLFGTILVDNEKANDSISKTSKEAESLSGKFTKGIKTIGEWGTKIGAAATVGATVIGAVVTKTVEATAEIEKLSKTTGMTTDEYQRWDAVMKKYNYSMEQASGDLAALGEKALDAANGAGEGAELFAKLGIVVTDNNGKLKSQEQLFNETIQALQGMENATERNAIASALLSTTGEELAPILNMTNEELNAMKSNANVIPDESIQKAQEFKESFDKIRNTFTTVVQTLAIELLPFFQKLFDWIIEYMPEIERTIKVVVNAVMRIFGVMVDTIDFLWESGLKVTFEGILDFVEGVFSGDWKKAWQGVEKVFSGIFGALGGIAEKPLNALSKFVKGIVDKIKGFFKFTISFPKIKLPHFSIKPKGWDIGDLLKGSIPKLGIDWYAKAMDNPMILDDPTIFGMQNGKLLGGGEAGNELIGGTDKIMSMIQDAVNNSNAGTRDALERIIALLDFYLKLMLKRKVVLDSGALVGELLVPLDIGLGELAKWKE